MENAGSDIRDMPNFFYIIIVSDKDQKEKLMGLIVHSLENIPLSARRDYFIYLLDYGWHEPIAQALRANYDEMVRRAATSAAVVIKGTELGHFENEVFSWHHINREDAEELLPALLITNAHPSYFLNSAMNFTGKRNILRVAAEYGSMKLVLIPFKRFCHTTADVVAIIGRLFDDIAAGRDLSDFRIVRELKKGVGSALVDAIIAEPAVGGFGIDLKKALGAITKR